MVFFKWPPVAILDVQKSLLTISDQCHKFYFCELFYKMAAGSHFGCLKLTFDGISGRFRSIQKLFFFKVFFTKWPPAPILDVQNSLSIAFLAISNRYATLFFIFDKMAAVGHFGCPKITFDHISGHFRSIRNSYFFCFTKWSLALILDVRNSRLIAFLAISDRYAIFFLNFLTFWMSEIHFRWHFWPFQISTRLSFWDFCTKWPAAPILDVRNSLSMAFLAISDQYVTFFFGFL